MLNSYTYNRKTIATAIEWMKSGKGEPPPFVKKNPGVFVNRKGTLYTKDGRRVIADEDTVPTMRELMFGKARGSPWSGLALSLRQPRVCGTHPARDCSVHFTAAHSTICACNAPCPG